MEHQIILYMDGYVRKRQEEKKKETLIIRNHDCITAKVGGDMHKECNAPTNGRRRRISAELQVAMMSCVHERRSGW